MPGPIQNAVNGVIATAVGVSLLQKQKEANDRVVDIQEARQKQKEELQKEGVIIDG